MAALRRRGHVLIRIALILASSTLLAVSAPAQEMSVFEACKAAPIGSEACDAEDLAESLGLLTAGQMRIFGDAGMESFAMLTALRYGASAIAFEQDGDGCFAEEERTAAVEIWSLWVELPDAAPDAIKARFEVFDGVMDGIVNMEVGC